MNMANEEGFHWNMEGEEHGGGRRFFTYEAVAIFAFG